MRLKERRCFLLFFLSLFLIVISGCDLFSDSQSEKANHDVLDTQPPTAPEDLSAGVIYANRIDISWSASTDNVAVAGYHIYRNGVQTADRVSTSYTDNAVSADNEYTYRISAYDASGNVSTCSNELLLSTFGASSISYAIDHSCINITDIPLEWIEAAKTDLHIAYGHTSHGAQVTRGMTPLDAFMQNKGYTAGTFAVNFTIEGGEGVLDFRDNTSIRSSDHPEDMPFPNARDLGTGGTPACDWDDIYVDYTVWISDTRAYLNSHSEINVIIWSWCGQVSYCDDSDITDYLNNMSQLEAEYPGVAFVYMTGHLDGTGLEGNLHRRNDIIREFCRNNNKWLFDFEDIESYDPDGNYFGDKFVTDACNYDFDNSGSTSQTAEGSDGTPAQPVSPDRNWAIDWQESHTPGIDWYESYITWVHTQHLNHNLKAYAMWWMLARIAGWEGTPDD